MHFFLKKFFWGYGLFLGKGGGKKKIFFSFFLGLFSWQIKTNTHGGGGGGKRGKKKNRGWGGNFIFFNWKKKGAGGGENF